MNRIFILIILVLLGVSGPASANSLKFSTYEDWVLWVGYGCPNQFDSKNIQEGPEKEAALVKGIISHEEKAARGFALSQEIIGCYYFIHKKDYRKGVYWLQKAALKGYPHPMSLLRYAYFHGAGVIEDFNEGFKWAFLAAARGEKIDHDVIKEVEKINSLHDELLEGKRRAQIWEKEHPDAFLIPY